MADEPKGKGEVPVARADTPTLFVDGFHGVAFLDGVVRINLTEQVFPYDPESGTERRVVARLAMGLPALLKFEEALAGIVEKLHKDGVIQTMDEDK